MSIEKKEQEQTIEELNAKLRGQLSMLEDKTIPLNKAMEIYKQAAITIEECYKALEKAQGEMVDINEQIEQLRAQRGEL